MSKKTSPCEGRGGARTHGRPPARAARAPGSPVSRVCELERCLLAELRRAARDGCRRRRLGIEPAERLEGRDPRLAQNVSLAAVDVGHQDEVIVGLALGVAGLLPAADRAVRDRLRVGVRAVRRDRRGSARAPAGSRPRTRRGGTTRARPSPRMTWIRSGGSPPWTSCEQLAVEAELDQEVGLGAAGELGVGDLVAPVAEIRGPIDLEQEVGVAAQGRLEEGRLVDDLGAVAHGFAGGVGHGSRARPGSCRPAPGSRLLPALRRGASPGRPARARLPSPRADLRSDPPLPARCAPFPRACAKSSCVRWRHSTNPFRSLGERISWSSRRYMS